MLWSWVVGVQTIRTLLLLPQHSTLNLAAKLKPHLFLLPNSWNQPHHLFPHVHAVERASTKALLCSQPSPSLPLQQSSSALMELSGGKIVAFRSWVMERNRSIFMDCSWPMTMLYTLLLFFFMEWLLITVPVVESEKRLNVTSKFFFQNFFFFLSWVLLVCILGIKNRRCVGLVELWFSRDELDFLVNL